MYLYFVTGTVKGDGSLSNGKYIVSNNVNNTRLVNSMKKDKYSKLPTFY